MAESNRANGSGVPESASAPRRSGEPTLRLTGGALRRLEHITPEGYVPQIDLALTDEWPYAQAFVIISALPKPVP